ncbi:MAG: zinc metallopeptidase [Brevinema sp.]
MFIFLMMLNLILLFVGIFVFRDYSLYFIIPGFIMVLWAQLNIQMTFGRWRQVPTSISGFEMATQILEENGIDDVAVEHIPGELTDHYDPRSKILRLSDATYSSNSVAAVAVAAHEVGHAIQHHKAYTPLVARNNFAPVAGFASSIWSWLILAGFFFRTPYLLEIGVICYGVFFLFAVITLPVEFDASNRAMLALKHDGSLDTVELQGARSVLNAAAMTYVAGAIMTLLQLLRLLYILNGRSND